MYLPRDAKFAPGRMLITPGAREALGDAEVQSALNRHLKGDWGELDDEDKRANDRCLKTSGRLFSAYESAEKARFWIITEADRSATTVLLPEEY